MSVLTPSQVKRIFGCSHAEYLILKPLGRTLNAFSMQRSGAKRRGISWQMNLWEWWSIWQKSGRWAERGPGAGYVMCRKGDVGPYSVDNVFIAKARENSSNQPQKKSNLPMGVKKTKYGRKNYAAYRRINGKKVFLGEYLTPGEASAAYRRAWGEGVQL